MPAKKTIAKKKRVKIPLGVRFIIFSFLNMDDLTNLAAKLSKSDRYKMIGNTILDQPKIYRLHYL